MSRRYVVIGNGIAGQTAAEELRKADADASIVMIAAERHPLYNRVALPRYLRGQVRREKVLMRTVEDYANRNLEIHFETWATEIDARSKVVRTNRGHEFPYDGRPPQAAAMAWFRRGFRLPGLSDPRRHGRDYREGGCSGAGARHGRQLHRLRACRGCELSQESEADLDHARTVVPALRAG